MHTLKKIVSYIQKQSLAYKIGGGIAVLLAIAAVAHFATSSASVSETASGVTYVRIASVASLSDQAGPLPVTGKVSSVSKASILAVSSGEIVSLRHSLGDYVAAGSVIASFENSSQRAAVLQAQGAYEGAQAALAKVSGSTAQNSDLTSAQAAQGAQNAASAARSTLRGAFASLDDAVHTKADPLFSNPQGNVPQFKIQVPDSQLMIDIQNQRATLDPLLESVRVIGVDESNTNIDENIATVIVKARTVEAFLNDMVEALNQATVSANLSESALGAYQSSVATARTQVLSTISGLISAKSAYNSASSGAVLAENSATAGLANDIASAEANVKSALGALNAAQANLEKTIIRAPISGTIVSLPLTRGGYISSFSPVAQISNPGALEVETYVTSDDAKTLVVGGKAVVDMSTNGIIVFIAPALDPTTGKIQVKLGIPGNQGALTDGETVSVSLERSATGGTKTSVKKAITIPIAAAKITPTGPVVFTVSSSTLVSNPVTFGPIVGGQVSILNGLSLEMDIVTDARGLSDGQKVSIDSTN